MKKLYNRLLILALLVSICSGITAGTWTPITNLPPFGTSSGLGFPTLLTDGTVIAQQYNDVSGNYFGTGIMWKLTPDITGSYANGTWSQIASLPVINSTQYAPLYHATAVLPDGRVIFQGGEYNGSVTADTTAGAIYDPVANTWTILAPPSFFGTKLGDASCVVLSNGTYMLANSFYLLANGGTAVAALLDAPTLTWTQTGSGKFDSNNEEGWTLLPNGEVLTVDCYVNLPSTPAASRTNTELYNPSTGTWSSAGYTTVTLTDAGKAEMGPAVLRPDGTVFALGSVTLIYTTTAVTSVGHANIYDTNTGIWSSAPDVPGGNGCPDAPAVLLPNGNVLFACGSHYQVAPTFFYEFPSDNSGYIAEPTPVNAVNRAAYAFALMMLPNGQVLSMDSTPDVEFYTPGSPTYNTAWEPVIYCSPRKVRLNHSYQVSGVLFNGMSQANMYGDDYQAATNYPIVRITNDATGHVFYCRTHNHINAKTGLPFMGVAATNVPVATTFDVPATVELGKSTLQVIANGIPSQPVCVFVMPATC